MAASPQDLPSSSWPHPSTSMNIIPRSVGPHLEVSLPDPPPPQGPGFEPGSLQIQVLGVSAGNHHSLGWQTHHLFTLELGGRAELSAHPAQACTKWNNTLRNLGFFKIPQFPPPSRELHKSGQAHAWEGRDRKPREAAPGSLRPPDTGHKELDPKQAAHS